MSPEEEWGPVHSEGKTFIAVNGTMFDITTRVRNRTSLWWFATCRECGGGESVGAGAGNLDELLEMHSRSDRCHARRARLRRGLRP